MWQKIVTTWCFACNLCHAMLTCIATSPDNATLTSASMLFMHESSKQASSMHAACVTRHCVFLDSHYLNVGQPCDQHNQTCTATFWCALCFCSWHLGELLVQGKPVCIVLHEQRCDSPPVSPVILAHVLDVDGLNAAYTGLLTVLNVSANTDAGLQHLLCWIRQNSWHVHILLCIIRYWFWTCHKISRTSSICWVTASYVSYQTDFSSDNVCECLI